MKVLVTANRKGGSGKTSTAFAVGAGLARTGARVLFLDLDSQANLTWDIRADKTKPGAMEILTGKAPVQSVIQHLEQWDAISPGAALEAADILIKGLGKEYTLKRALKAVSDKYDHCIIDTGPALSMATINALTAADGVLMTAQPERHSIEGIVLLYDILKQVRSRSNTDLEIYGIVITRYKSRGCLHRDMVSNIEAVAGMIGTKIYKTPIRECLAIQESEEQRTEIYKYSPRSNGARDYKALLEDLLEDMKGDNEQ